MRSFVALLFVAMFLGSIQPAHSFFDLDEILRPFRKKHEQTVHIINHIGCPVVIDEAHVGDRGSDHFKTFTGILDTYRVKVRNASGKKILAYRVAWTLKHPFQNWVFRKIVANSIDMMDVGTEQTVSFKRDKHYRQDAYYYAEIIKVEFDDETIWEAPEHDDAMTVEDILQQEIDEMDETSIDDLSLDEVHKLLPSADEEQELESESIKPEAEAEVEEVPAAELEVK
ncbi:MAG: hypothetical protein OXU45_04285 [Candidatus Melainabacteria bacterium]|nr:hypothetical protein [Candidatus Melainabacteria bacterium]